MRNSALRMLVLLFLAVPLAGQTGEWKRYKNVDGNFSVLFPVEPTDTLNGEQGEVCSHTLLALARPYAYTVVYTTMTREQTVDEATYEVFKDAAFKELPKCSVVTVGAVSPAIPGYIGHWYRLSCDMTNGKLTMVGNLYMGRHYAYLVMAMFPTASDPPTIKKFTDSFSLIDANK